MPSSETGEVQRHSEQGWEERKASSVKALDVCGGRKWMSVDPTTHALTWGFATF